MADADSAAIPQYLGADCLACEEGLALEAIDADTDDKRAWYQCPNCGHVAELRLDPDDDLPDRDAL